MSGESYCSECGATYTGLPHQCEGGNMILLTDEQLRGISLRLNLDTDFTADVTWEWQEIAKAQLKKVVEWVIEQNDFGEPEDNSPGAYYVISKNLWQALLEEVKE